MVNTKFRKKLNYYLAMALLYSSRPFSSIRNWLWRLHRTVLDWNK